MRKRHFSYLIAVGFGCVACGGSGGSAQQASNVNAGTYIGEYIDQNNKVGEFQLTVKPTGVVTGQYLTPTGVVTAVKGSIDQSGHGNLTLGTSTASVQMNGVNPQQSNLLSIVPVGIGQPTTEVTLTLVPPSALPTSNPFTGSYGGYITDTTTNKTSALAIGIVPWGAFTGQQIAINDRGYFNSSDIIGNISSTGALSFTIYGQVITATGNLTKASNIQGTVLLSNGDSANIVLYPIGAPFGPPPPSK